MVAMRAKRCCVIVILRVSSAARACESIIGDGDDEDEDESLASFITFERPMQRFRKRPNPAVGARISASVVARGRSAATLLPWRGSGAAMECDREASTADSQLGGAQLFKSRQR